MLLNKIDIILNIKKNQINKKKLDKFPTRNKKNSNETIICKCQVGTTKKFKKV